MTGLCGRCVYQDACGTPARTEPCEGRKTLRGCEKCIICGRPIRGLGNNPAPVKEVGHCCDKCNAEIVIPKRFRLIAEGGAL